MHPNLPFFCRAVAYDKGMNKRKFTTLFAVVFRCLLGLFAFVWAIWQTIIYERVIKGPML